MNAFEGKHIMNKKGQVIKKIIFMKYTNLNLMTVIRVAEQHNKRLIFYIPLLAFHYVELTKSAQYLLGL